MALVQPKYTDRSPIARYANRRFRETVDALLAGRDFYTVLDAGCGEGFVLEQVARAGQYAAFGVDLDSARVRLAASRGVPGWLAVANAQQLPYDDNSFDLVMLLEVLEHVGSPEQVLRELRRVARRYLLISVPNEPWWRMGNMARLKYLPAWGNTPEHINHWSARAFIRLVGSCFSILRATNPVLWTFVLAEKAA
ncbi:MAG: class I SAM-dependent methyltransferase [Chloroflexi bacterium]|nr:class I SAM-dependent methyltransferase [Chloroflexota bacterium]